MTQLWLARLAEGWCPLPDHPKLTRPPLQVAAGKMTVEIKVVEGDDWVDMGTTDGGAEIDGDVYTHSPGGARCSLCLVHWQYRDSMLQCSIARDSTVHLCTIPGRLITDDNFYDLLPVLRAEYAG